MATRQILDYICIKKQRKRKTYLNMIARFNGWNERIKHFIQMKAMLQNYLSEEVH